MEFVVQRLYNICGILMKIYRIVHKNIKGKLAHKFSTCYLECISYQLPMDKKIMTEKIGKKLYNPCIRGKEKKIWKSHQCGFPHKSLCDVIRWEFP